MSIIYFHYHLIIHFLLISFILLYLCSFLSGVQLLHQHLESDSTFSISLAFLITSVFFFFLLPTTLFFIATITPRSCQMPTFLTLSIFDQMIETLWVYSTTAILHSSNSAFPWPMPTSISSYSCHCFQIQLVHVNFIVIFQYF